MATTLFGGVQFFNTLISVIKTKVITVLIGVDGFGILGLFTSTIRLIIDCTKIGLDTSAVKEISEFNSKEDKTDVLQFVVVLNKVIWITGIIGSLLTILFSNWLSIWTFGNDQYKYGFIWLSIAILFSQLSNGKTAILRGTHQLGNLAKANLWGSFAGLVVSLPFYFYLGKKGIVPAIIMGFVVSYLAFAYFSKSNQNKPIKLGFKELIQKSKSMLSLGATMSVTSLFVALTLWLIQIYIRNHGGLEDVGFYTAGFLIINAYIGMVFNAMGTDYFPRLSVINKNNILINKEVNEQADVAILLITPIIAVFLTFAPLIIRILYTKEFLVILGMVTFGVLGNLFRAVSFSLGYILIAKGDSRVFIKTSLGFNILMFSICILSYNFFGLTGIGMGLMIYYMIHFIVLKILTNSLYGVILNKRFYKTFLICIALCTLSYLGTLIDTNLFRYTTMILISVASGVFTLLQLQSRMNIKALLIDFLRNKN
ncbi:O-antigen translocase [Yeosuana aromativorans]|uniref:O-antigen translocase n=1 Tax=Yeosuana aromativorans TaxID=288019 RepID=A0A8J3FJW9_9FLAO|nr:oligosaccharide flippase family protein [Yeosuana aromativorans]GGK25594.1 O-antigen translocase [Yeosuana aromativorans]